MSGWGEPVVLMTHDGTEACTIGEHPGRVPCPRAAKWEVELAGYDDSRQPTEDGPAGRACTIHLAALAAALLEENA